MTSSLRTTIGAAAVDDGAHRQFGLERHADLAHQDEVERRVERRATSAATGTPPRGSASTTGLSRL